MAALQITTYDQLLAAAASWLNRDDLVDQLPAFVALSESQFNRELRLRDMMVRADATSDQEIVSLPEDWLEHYSLVVPPGGPPVPPGYTPAPLVYMSEKESNAYKSKSYNAGGATYGYTIIGNTIELIPAPTGNVDLVMVYYQRIPPLGATQPINWLLAKSPDLYLYSTLVQAEPYLKNDERLQTWASLRAAIMEGMRLESERALRPTSGMVVARARSFG